MSAKGELRRAALVRAASGLLREAGFDALSHRAVAARAQLPLAATTYYFDSLEELVIAAVDEAAHVEIGGARAVVDALQPRARSARATAHALVRLVVAGDPDPGRLLGLYERYVQAGRLPQLREPVRRWNVEVAGLLGEALAACGRPVDADTAALLLSCVDGVIVTALAEGEVDVEAAAVRRLAVLVKALAPRA